MNLILHSFRDIHLAYPILNVGNLEQISEGLLPYFFKDLFLTPDEYLSGSLELAHKARSEMSAYMLIDGPVNWEKELKRHFDQYYRGWPKSKEFSIGDPAGADKWKVRSGRLNSALEARGLQTKMGPENYTTHFNSALNNFTVPSIETYFKALKYSNGAIHIRNSARSQGIK